MRRESRGKHLVLTERDLEIFRLLERYRYLNSEFLHAFVGGRSEKRFKERLGDLFHEGYIDRPQRQWEFAESRHSAVIYEAGEGSRVILQSRQEDMPLPLTFLKGHAHRQFHHSVMISQIMAALELSTRTRQGLTLLGWGDILAKAPISARRGKCPFAIPCVLPNPTLGHDRKTASSIVPDAVFGFRYNDACTLKYRFFALEVDRATMPVTRSSFRASSYHRKLLAYDQALKRGLYKSLWGIPNLLILTISTDAAHLQNLLGPAQRLGDFRTAFLFKAIGESQAAGPSLVTNLVTLPWVSAGRRKIDIFQADGNPSD